MNLLRPHSLKLVYLRFRCYGGTYIDYHYIIIPPLSALLPFSILVETMTVKVSG